MSSEEAFHSAEIVRDARGRQYHIGVAPGEVAPYCLLVGDPARAERISERFDSVAFERRNREYVTFTGVYKGVEVSVMATGIGCDNTEIAVIELAQTRDDITFLRVGSCGGLQPEIALGDLVVSTGSVRMENTSTFFVPEGYPAVAHWEVILAVIEAARVEGFPFHVGLTATASGFYGAQGREVPGFPPRFKNLDEQLQPIGVKNFEMEASTLFTLSTLRGLRSGAVCAVYANRGQNQFITPRFKDTAELRAIQTGLRAVRILARMDEARGSEAYWSPSTGDPRVLD